MRTLCLTLLAIPLLTASAIAGPPPAPLVQLAGSYDGVHRDWRDVVRLAPDGTYARGNGDPGRWHFDGRVLTLQWKNWGPERLEWIGPGHFRAADGHFELIRRGLPEYRHVVGTYEGTHPDWRDRVTLAPDGTFARGNGDPGTWVFDGRQLVLYWRNWGPSTLRLVSPGQFVGDRGFRLVRVGQVPPPPPPPPVIVDEQPVPGGVYRRLLGVRERVYHVGQLVRIHYHGMPGNGTDWIAVVHPNEPANTWGNWEYTNGAANGLREVTGLTPGEWEARAYFNGGTTIEDRVRFRVVP